LPHVKISLSKVQCSHIATFINVLGYPDRKTQNKIDHILKDRRRHSGILHIRSFRAADCDTDHYLVVAKIRGRLAVNRQRSHRFHMENFNLKKLNEVEVKEQYGVEVSNRFAVGWILVVLGK
jgi:hypothetical protein